MLLSSIKTILLVGFTSAWIICMSEYTFIKCLTEFENFYVSRFQSNHNLDQTLAISQKIQRWTQSTGLHHHVFANRNIQIQMHTVQFPQDQNIEIYHQRTISISPLLKPFLPSSACIQRQKIQDRGLIICAKSIGNFKP